VAEGNDYGEPVDGDDVGGGRKGNVRVGEGNEWEGGTGGDE